MSTSSPVRVRDLMVSEFHHIDGVAKVDEAMRLMKRLQVNALVVRRRDENDEVGLVEIADIARGVIAVNRAPERVNVYEIMTKPVLPITEEMLAHYAVRLLVRFGLTRAVVMGHNHEPVGIITLRDLVIGQVPDESS